jgi:hypothetical protein
MDPPVPAVDAAVAAAVDPAADRRELQLTLARIAARLSLLEQRLGAAS